MRGIAEVLGFWFSETAEQHWFASTPAFDREIRERFADLSASAARGELSAWEESPDGSLALCILLDQMPRNMYRGTPRVYAADPVALAVATRAVNRGFDRGLPPKRKQFLYLPFSHSERLVDQLRAVALFEAAGLDEEALRFARSHLDIIRRFGRFPHRNAILGRASTPEELAFLIEHPESYGQKAIHSDGEADAGAAEPAAGDRAASAARG